MNVETPYQASDSTRDITPRLRLPHRSGSRMALEQLKRLKAVAFYANLFIKSSKQTQVQEVARSFDLEIRIKWPRYHEELQGIADGSKRGILDIVAIIARPEIAFGLFSDGYTSLFWDTPGTIFLVQN